MVNDLIRKERYTGCLLGGAVGDALGWPLECLDLPEILKRYGPAGIMAPVAGTAGLFEITDDTQMTLFTAEGLLRAWAGACHFGGSPDFSGKVLDSYRCWLATQRPGTDLPTKVGWLWGVAGLHRKRGPGLTCLKALRAGTFDEHGIAVNDSKGCGGVMRAAPCGLLAARIHDNDAAGALRLGFDLGCATAALTHGHPSGYYSAGVMATVIAAIVTGGTLRDGIEASFRFLEGRRGSEETVTAVTQAVRLAHDPTIPPSPEVIATLGCGWVGEEALAIGLYCAFVSGDDFARGVRLAVNHSGDSDSTGSVTGNILGALLGEKAIPATWLDRLELRETIRLAGEDLFTAFQVGADWLQRYPA